MINLFRVYQNATIEIPSDTVYHNVLNHLIYRWNEWRKWFIKSKYPLLKDLSRRLYGWKALKEYFYRCIFLYSSQKFFHIPKPFYFRLHIRLSRGTWKSSTAALYPVKLIKNDSSSWSTRGRVDHSYLPCKGRSKSSSNNWSSSSAAHR